MEYSSIYEQKVLMINPAVNLYDSVVRIEDTLKEMIKQ